MTHNNEPDFFDVMQSLEDDTNETKIRDEIPVKNAHKSALNEAETIDETIPISSADTSVTATSGMTEPFSAAGPTLPIVDTENTEENGGRSATKIKMAVAITGCVLPLVLCLLAGIVWAVSDGEDDAHYSPAPSIHTAVASPSSTVEATPTATESEPLTLTPSEATEGVVDKCGGTSSRLAFDHDRHTAWVCPRKKGVDGAVLTVRFSSSSTVEGIDILPGFDMTDEDTGIDEWTRHRVVWKINAEFDDGTNIDIDCRTSAKTRQWCRHPLNSAGKPVVTRTIIFTIKKTAPPTGSGEDPSNDPWEDPTNPLDTGSGQPYGTSMGEDDFAISEIQMLGRKAT